MESKAYYMGFEHFMRRCCYEIDQTFDALKMMCQLICCMSIQALLHVSCMCTSLLTYSLRQNRCFLARVENRFMMFHTKYLWGFLNYLAICIMQLMSLLRIKGVCENCVKDNGMFFA